MPWTWVDVAVVNAIHDEQIAEHGGGVGVRDQGLLESALARPMNLEAYGEPHACDLAAAYAHGIARNHPFADGNKRASLVVAETFLALNGHELAATDEECVVTMVALAEGSLDEPTLAAWFRSRVATLG